MFPQIPNAAMRVRNPTISPIPPKNSAAIARNASGAGMCIIRVNAPMVAHNPYPPNHPSIFWAPCAKKTTPRTILRIAVAVSPSVFTSFPNMFRSPSVLCTSRRAFRSRRRRRGLLSPDLHAAIDHDVHTRHVRALSGGEEQRHARHLLGLAQATQEGLSEHVTRPFGVLQLLSSLVRLDHAWRNRVGANPVLAPLHGELSCHPDDPGLR